MTSNLKHAFIATLCSAFILPGLGQVINRQLIKGLIIMAAITILFVIALIKVLLEVSAAMGEVLGPDLTFGRDEWMLLLQRMQDSDLTLLYIILALGAALWGYAVFDAFVNGRRYQPLDLDQE